MYTFYFGTARFRKFWSGNLRVLLEESLQSSRQSLILLNHTIPSDTNIEDPDTDSLIPASLLAKAEILAKDGLISKAAAVLNQSPMAPATEETFQRLQQLHPRRARPATSAIPPSQSHTQSNLNIHFYTASIIKSINDAPRKSMPGPSGWRYEHLKCIVHKDFHVDISPLLEMLSAILRSQLPAEILDILRTTTLLAILKDSNGAVRPLALTDVLQRIVTKVLPPNIKMNGKDLSVRISMA